MANVSFIKQFWIIAVVLTAQFHVCHHEYLDVSGKVCELCAHQLQASSQHSDCSMSGCEDFDCTDCCSVQSCSHIEKLQLISLDISHVAILELPCWQPSPILVWEESANAEHGCKIDGSVLPFLGDPRAPPAVLS